MGTSSAYERGMQVIISGFTVSVAVFLVPKPKYWSLHSRHFMNRNIQEAHFFNPS